MMNLVAVFDFIVATAVVAGIFSYWLGYNTGVRETEQRWSDAVRVKEAHDAYDAANRRR